MKIQCKDADKYDVKSPPKCKCFVCLTRWTLKNIVTLIEEKHQTDTILRQLVELNSKRIDYLEKDLIMDIIGKEAKKVNKSKRKSGKFVNRKKK